MKKIFVAILCLSLSAAQGAVFASDYLAPKSKAGEVGEIMQNIEADSTELGTPIFKIRPNVLLVEDNPDSRKLIQQQLESVGYNVITAVNGKEGLEKISDRVDLVVSGVEMPGMTGIEMAKRIRGLRPWMRIIIMSADSKYRNEASGLANEFLYKNEKDSNEKLIGLVRRLAGEPDREGYPELAKKLQKMPVDDYAMAGLLKNWRRYANVIDEMSAGGERPIVIDALRWDKWSQSYALINSLKKLRLAPAILIAGNFRDCMKMIARIGAIDGKLPSEAAFFGDLIQTDMPVSLRKALFRDKEKFQEAPFIAWERFSAILGNDLLPLSKENSQEIADALIQRLSTNPDKIILVVDALWYLCLTREKFEDAVAMVTIKMPKMGDKETTIWLDVISKYDLTDPEKRTITAKLICQVIAQRVHQMEEPADEFSKTGVLPVLPYPYKVSPVVLRGNFSYEITEDTGGSKFRADPLSIFLEKYGIKVSDTTFRSIGRGFDMTPLSLSENRHKDIFGFKPVAEAKFWILSHNRRPAAVVTGTGKDKLIVRPLTEDDSEIAGIFQKAAKPNAVALMDYPAIIRDEGERSDALKKGLAYLIFGVTDKKGVIPAADTDVPVPEEEGQSLRPFDNFPPENSVDSSN